MRDAGQRSDAGMPAGPALAAAAVAVGVMLEVTRRIARPPRSTVALEQANGSYFGALPLRDRPGRRAGLVFGYEGRPSWVLVLVQEAAGSGRWKVKLETRSRGPITLGSFEVSRGRGSSARRSRCP